MDDKKENLKLTEGSRYKIISIGSRENPLETDGVFKGFANLGIDEGALIMELTETHGEMNGIKRLVPLHAILAIDILDAKEHSKKEDKETHHYYG